MYHVPEPYGFELRRILWQLWHRHYMGPALDIGANNDLDNDQLRQAYESTRLLLRKCGAEPDRKTRYRTLTQHYRQLDRLCGKDWTRKRWRHRSRQWERQFSANMWWFETRYNNVVGPYMSFIIAKLHEKGFAQQILPPIYDDVQQQTDAEMAAALANYIYIAELQSAAVEFVKTYDPLRAPRLRAKAAAEDAAFFAELKNIMMPIPCPN